MSYKKNIININEDETVIDENSVAYLLGIEAFKETLRISSQDSDPSTKNVLLDDVDIVFEYLYLEVVTAHPKEAGVEVTLKEKDRDNFIAGWEKEEDEYLLDMEKTFEENKKNKNDYGLFSIKDLYNKEYKKEKDSYLYSRYKYVEPTFIYNRFNKVEKSTKKIIFPKEWSKLFWEIFQTASGKEIMFYGELTQSEENPYIYNVSGMNFPPQKNYGGYVETVDDKYEKWIFNEIILKGKKIPLHVHTHPDFSAFSSSIDEVQIKQYIEDNTGNPFVVQLIVSNPRKGTYFIRWFDLENNTWEKPVVEFTYDKYNVEENYPGIFQFNAPPRYATSASSRISSFEDDRSWYDDFKQRKDIKSDSSDKQGVVFLDDDDEDKGSPDLTDPEEFDKYFSKKYNRLSK